MNHRLTKGFTLIELMVAVVLLGLVAGSLYTLRTETALMHRDNAARQKAVWALASQAAVLRDAPPAALGDAHDVPFSDELGLVKEITRGRGSYSVEETGPGVKKITLKVAWKDSKMRDRELTLTQYRCLK
ncbi:MAG: prepilin-type N-terminal cleavage/methylation domain-containing protein [Thermodesulfobacteriota bacterium]